MNNTFIMATIKKYEEKECFLGIPYFSKMVETAYSGDKESLEILVDYIDENDPEQVEFLNKLKEHLLPKPKLPVVETIRMQNVVPIQKPILKFENVELMKKAPILEPEKVKDIPSQTRNIFTKDVIDPEDKVPIHPASWLIPRMNQKDFEKYKKKITKRKYLSYAIIVNGQFLGDVNYLYACQQVGRQLQARHMTVDDPYSYVMAEKVSLSNLSQSQKAAVAVSETKIVKRIANKQPGQTWNHYLARMFDTNERYIGYAKEIKQFKASLFKEVIDGEKNISAATKEVKPPKELVSYFKSEEILSKILVDFPDDKIDTLLDIIPRSKGKMRDIIQARTAKYSQKLMVKTIEENSNV